MTPDEVYAEVVARAAEAGLELYPHQDEAVIELLSGNNVVLATRPGQASLSSLRPPTGLRWPTTA